MTGLDYDAALARRQELIEAIALAADQIAAIDAALPTLRSVALEEDLNQAEPAL